MSATTIQFKKKHKIWHRFHPSKTTFTWLLVVRPYLSLGLPPWHPCTCTLVPFIRFGIDGSIISTSYQEPKIKSRCLRACFKKAVLLWKFSLEITHDNWKWKITQEKSCMLETINLFRSEESSTNTKKDRKWRTRKNYMCQLSRVTCHWSCHITSCATFVTCL